MSRTDSYPLTIDYDRSFAELVAAGGYDHANDYVTEARFPVHGRASVTRELLLVCLEETASTAEVLAALDVPGCRLGRIEELLALGAVYPELQRSFPIVALGSIATYPDDYRRIPFLWGSPRVRHLDLRWDEHSWGGNIRFLTARAGSGPDPGERDASRAIQPACSPNAPAVTGSPAAINARAFSTRP